MIRSMNRSLLSALFGAPIGLVAGLIGVGGAEYRLPVLAGPLRFSAREAVPINLSISLVTVAVSALVRAGTLPLDPVVHALPALVALALGATASAYVGAAYVHRLPEQRLEQVILVLLLGMGLLMMVQGLRTESAVGLLSVNSVSGLFAACVLGLMIGLVSVTLGVAGGELILPSLILVFGVDVKSAGTSSLLVSLPTMLAGIYRYARQGGLADHQALKEVALPMAAASLVGAVAGGLLVGWAPVQWLKIGLGALLILASYQIFWRGRAGTRRTQDSLEDAP